jgi:hypothetical protein
MLISFFADYDDEGDGDNKKNNNNKVGRSFSSIGCLRVLSISVYQLLGTVVHSSFCPLL